MGAIHLLEETVANQIAAGEVVERPASVVKELIENALDAGARQVELEARQGGLTYLRVTDNGNGMSQEDLVLSVERHATSKIRTAADLFSVKTLGFRGEALPSIASVSHLTLRSRPSDAASPASSSPSHGFELLIDGGKKGEPQPVGMPPGTTVIVQDLFFNTPARRKFMKSSMAELYQITRVLSENVVAYPEVAFRFMHDGKLILASVGNGERLDAILSAYDPTWQKELLPISFSQDGITVEGFIGKPTFTRGTRQAQSYFVNRRIVRNFLLGKVLEEAYRTLVPKGRFPVAMLALTLPPGEVDVNVHPTKREVRFQNQEKVLRVLSQAVKGTLYQGMGDVLPGGEAFRLSQGRPFGEGAFSSLRGAGRESPSLNRMREDGARSLPWDGKEAAAQLLAPERASVERASSREATWRDEDRELLGASPLLFSDQDGKSQTVYQEAFAKPLDFARFSPVAQLGATYIIATNGQDLLLLDQHAAHERILYERIRVSRAKQKKDIQLLLVPATVELSPSLAPLFEEKQSVLEAIGFQVDLFGDRTYAVRAVPAVVARRDPKQLFVEMLEDLSELPGTSRVAELEERIDKFMACRGAVMAGDSLSREEMKAILTDLGQAPHFSVCPHGRPTYIQYAKGDLARLFKRV